MNKPLVIILIIGLALLVYLIFHRPAQEEPYTYIDTEPMETYEPPALPYQEAKEAAEAEGFRPATPLPPEPSTSSQ